MLTDADRLSMIKSLGGELFRTSTSDDLLMAVFESEFNDPELSGIAVEGEIRWLECRLSDKAAFNLVKGSKLTRVADNQEFFVRRFEPSESSGFLILRLGR